MRFSFRLVVGGLRFSNYFCCFTLTYNRSNSSFSVASRFVTVGFSFFFFPGRITINMLHLIRSSNSSIAAYIMWNGTDCVSGRDTIIIWTSILPLVGTTQTLTTLFFLLYSRQTHYFEFCRTLQRPSHWDSNSQTPFKISFFPSCHHHPPPRHSSVLLHHALSLCTFPFSNNTQRRPFGRFPSLLLHTEEPSLLGMDPADFRTFSGPRKQKCCACTRILGKNKKKQTLSFTWHLTPGWWVSSGESNLDSLGCSRSLLIPTLQHDLYFALFAFNPIPDRWSRRIFRPFEKFTHFWHLRSGCDRTQEKARAHGDLLLGGRIGDDEDDAERQYNTD